MIGSRPFCYHRPQIDNPALQATEVVNHIGSFSFENVTIEPLKKGRSLNSPQGAR